MISYTKITIFIIELFFISSLAIEFPYLDPTEGRFIYVCSPNSATLYFLPNSSYAASIVVDPTKFECRKFFKINRPLPSLEIKFSTCTSGLRLFDVILANHGVWEWNNMYYKREVDCRFSSDEININL